MALIAVPKPPKKAYDPDRDMSSLLKSQIEHLREAESKLPVRYRTEFYIRAIKTEGEAAQYIREVTDAIHLAHEHAERKRREPKKKKGVIEIAAVADERAEREHKRPRTRGVKTKKRGSTKRRKK